MVGEYSSAISYQLSCLQKYLPKADMPERMKNGRG
jgi:hypothetical protein